MVLGLAVMPFPLFYLAEALFNGAGFATGFKFAGQTFALTLVVAFGYLARLADPNLQLRCDTRWFLNPTGFAKRAHREHTRLEQ
jgi:hypothetical protein